MSKLSKAHLRFYKRLIDAEAGIPRSQAPKTLPFEKLFASGAIESSRASAGSVLHCNPNQLRAALSTLFDIRDLEGALEVIGAPSTKGAIAITAGTTKALSTDNVRNIVSLRACSLRQSIFADLHGAQLEVPNTRHASLTIDSEFLSSIVGAESAIICENSEDFDMLDMAMLNRLSSKQPQPTLVLWLQDGLKRIQQVIDKAKIQDVYHFGDFDLCGMRIFETNTQKYFPRAQFLMPDLTTLDELIQSTGSDEIYYGQINRVRSYKPSWPEGAELAKVIRTHKKVIEQETVREALLRANQT